MLQYANNYLRCYFMGETTVTQLHRSMTYVIIVTGVLVIAWFGTPKHTFAPRGVFLSNGQHYAAISADNVTINSDRQPIIGNDIGTMNIEAYIADNRNKTILAAEQYAAQLAAKHGANRVVITLLGFCAGK